MGELADLGLRVQSNISAANKDLDAFAQKSGTAERASDSLGRGSVRAGGAIAQMMASIERSVRSMEMMMRAATGYAAAQDAAATSTNRATASISQAYAVNTRYAASFTGIVAGAGQAKVATDGLAASTNRAGDEARRTAHDFGTLYDAYQRDFFGQYINGMNRYLSGMDKVEVSTKKAAQQQRIMTMTTLNLSRQVADIGVTAAMGMNPLMILIQQGPQIADAFAMAKAEGIGFRQALGGIASGAGRVAVLLAPIAIAAAAAATGFGLMYRELNKGFPKDITKGMNLTEEQLERVKTKTVTMGHVWKSTLDVMGKYLMQGPLGDGIRAIGKLWNDFLDQMARGAFRFTAVVAGTLLGLVKTVQANWRSFPAMMKDIFTMAVNGVIDELQRMVNVWIGSLNEIKKAASIIMPQLMMVPDIAQVDFSSLKGEVSGAAKFMGMALKANVTQEIENAETALKRIGKEIGTGALALARKDTLKQAGKANKDPKGREAPRDTLDERLAQLSAATAQAYQDELQARKALTTDVEARAGIERKMIQMRLAEKQAQIARQIASIADDKGLTAAAKAELTARWRGVALINDIVASQETQAVNQELSAALAKQAAEAQREALQDQIDLLSAQADLLHSSYARAVAEREILTLQQRQARSKYEEIIASETATAFEKAEAAKRLANLKSVQGLEAKQLERQTRLVNAIDEAASAARSFRDAFKRGDWVRLFDDLKQTIETVKAAFREQGMLGGIATAASAIGGMVGGRTGRTLQQGAGMYAMAAPLVGGPIAAAAAALYTAAKLLNVGGKPSNKGAGFDLTTGALSGNKRSEETEQAARSAGDAIRGIQDALKAAGIGLTDSVRGLVIGTRDQTQIYLQSGKTLMSAVGDSGAAVDTAMRALLESANFVSEAQKNLVMSAVSAGKGFDAVQEILAKYEAANQISGNIANEILRLTNPKQYDINAVTKAIEEQRKAAKTLADDGFITAEVLAKINQDLSKLEGLQLDEVMKRYAEAVEDATDITAKRMGMEAQLMRLQGNESGAIAIERQLALDELPAGLRVLQTLIWKEEELAESRARAQQVLDQRAGLELRLAQALGNEELAVRIQREQELAAVADDVNRALLRQVFAAEDASKSLAKAIDAVSVARSNLSAAYDKERGELEATRDRALQAAESMRAFRKELIFGSAAGNNMGGQYAATQREFQRLSALSANDPERLANIENVGAAFIEASRNSAGSATAVARDRAAVLRAVEASEKAAKAEADVATKQLTELEKLVAGQLGTTAAVGTVAQELVNLHSALAQLAAAQAAVQAATANENTSPFGDLSGFQTTNRWQKALPAFNTGGSLRVAGSGGTDSQMIQFMASPGEVVNVSKGDVQEALLSEIRALRAEVAQLKTPAEKTAKNTGDISDKLTRAMQGGDHFVTIDEAAA